MYVYIFWQSSASGALSTLVTSVVLYSLTRATLTSPGYTGMCQCICIYGCLSIKGQKQEFSAIGKCCFRSGNIAITDAQKASWIRFYAGYFNIIRTA